MAQADDAIRESEQARRRLTELAGEIGRRATAEHVRREARTLVREKTEEMRALATDKRREWTAKAKETAVNKGIAYRDKAMGSPRFLAVAGALFGAWAGRRIARSRRFSGERRIGVDDRREAVGLAGRTGTEIDLRRDLDAGGRIDEGRGDVSGEPGISMSTGYVPGLGPPIGDIEGIDMSGESGQEGASLETKAEALKERAGAAIGAAKGRISEVAGRVSGQLRSTRENVGIKAGHLRESLPGTDEMKVRTAYVYRDQPWAVAAGALAIGLLAALFLPMSDRERSAIRPMKLKARDALHDVGSKLEDQVSAGDGAAAGEDAGAGDRGSAFIGRESVVASREDSSDEDRLPEQDFEPPTVH
jgi:hypothetical protein